eukprot:scaffold39069_cov154-Skeletonema_marinoi.AAC.20
MTEHCFRMTIQPADVAKAKELFAANHEDADEDWAEEEEAENEDETMDDEEEAEEEKDDDALFYDGSDNEESHNDDAHDDVYIDEDKYPQHNAYSPMFDAAYPTVGEIVHLTDAQFSEKILVPLIRDVTHSDIPLAEGVDGMFNRAMYAFVVVTLCANNECSDKV